jgi:O-antigen/teichoic acid export membrane protein
VRVVRRAGWGLADQGLFSASNLLLTIVVARSVEPAEFGAFSLCYVVYMLAANLGRVTGSKPYTIELVEAGVAAGVRTRQVLGYSTALGAALAVVAAVWGVMANGPLAEALLVLAVLLPGLLLQDCVRSVYFAREQPRGAFAVDALATGLQVVGVVVVLTVDEHPSVGWLMAAWGLSAALAAVIGCGLLRSWPGRPRVREWFRDHGALAAPLTLNMVLTAAPSYVAYLAMPLVSTLPELAAVRGAYVFFGPLNVVYSGAALVALPAIVRASPTRSRPGMSLQISSGLAGVAVAWGAVVVLLPDRLGTLVLGDLWYDTDGIRILLAVSLVAEALFVGPELVLSSLRLPGRMTTVRLVAAVATVSLSLALAARFGGVGLAAGFAAGYSLGAVLAMRQAALLGPVVPRPAVTPGSGPG